MKKQENFMRKSKAGWLMIALGVVGLNISTASAGSRDVDKVGIFFGFIGAPFPSIFGVNAGYNAASFLRGSVGVGFTNVSDPTLTVKATTLNAEAKALIPGWNFSPTAALGFSHVSMTVTGTGDTSALGGLTGSGSAFYAGPGIDWQTGYGFNLGFEYKILFKTSDGLPSIYFGWYF
jgi:hypothetical protein